LERAITISGEAPLAEGKNGLEKDTAESLFAHPVANCRPPVVRHDVYLTTRLIAVVKQCP
jgi:hypothetical protein